MPGGLARHLLGRETGAARLPRRCDLPTPRCGVLVLDEALRPANFPGGPLTWLTEAIHYLDLGGIQATSLREFGGAPALWAGVTKLYASNCSLESLDGVEALRGVLWLYLDNNRLEQGELLRLLSLPPNQLKALDLSGNPGFSEEVVEALEAGGLLAALEYLNGCKWKPSPPDAGPPLDRPDGWDI